MNRSSQCAPCIGQGVVSSIQPSVQSTVWSNLGQTWSTLVKLGQTSPNSGKCILGRVSRVFGHSGLQSGQKWLGQTWSNFGKCVPDLLLRVIWCGEPSSDQAGLVRAVSFYVSTPEKIPGVKMGLWHMAYLGFFTWFSKQKKKKSLLGSWSDVFITVLNQISYTTFSYVFSI